MKEAKDKSIEVVEAERISGGLLIHFSNQTSTLFHAQFLYDVREHDGNVAIVEEGEEVSGS